MLREVVECDALDMDLHIKREAGQTTARITTRTYHSHCQVQMA